MKLKAHVIGPPREPELERLLAEDRSLMLRLVIDNTDKDEQDVADQVQPATPERESDPRNPNLPGLTLFACAECSAEDSGTQ